MDDLLLMELLSFLCIAKGRYFKFKYSSYGVILVKAKPSSQLCFRTARDFRQSHFWWLVASLNKSLTFISCSGAESQHFMNSVSINVGFFFSQSLALFENAHSRREVGYSLDQRNVAKYFSPKIFLLTTIRGLFFIVIPSCKSPWVRSMWNLKWAL